MGQRTADGFGSGEVLTFGDCVQGRDLVGSEADGDDLHGLGAPAGPTSAAALECLDVVASLGLVDPLLDLLVGDLVLTYAIIVNENMRLCRQERVRCRRPSRSTSTERTTVRVR